MPISQMGRAGRNKKTYKLLLSSTSFCHRDAEQRSGDLLLKKDSSHIFGNRLSVANKTN